MGLDLKPKTWYWQQWLATVAFIMYLIISITTPYLYMFRIRWKLTLATIVITLVSFYNYGYVVGAFMNLEKKKYVKLLVAPPLLILVELFISYLLGRAIKIQIYYLGYIKYLLVYGFMILSFYLCYLGVEYKYEYLTDEELKELGVDV